MWAVRPALVLLPLYLTIVTIFTENSISVILKQAKPLHALLTSQIKTRLKSFLVSKATQKYFLYVIIINNVNQISLNCEPYWPEHEIGNTNITHF